MSNDQQQNEQQEESSPLDNFSFLRVFGAVAFGLGAVMLLAVSYRDFDTSTTIRTYDNGYGSSEVVVEGPFGKSVCRTTTVGGQSVTKCD